MSQIYKKWRDLSVNFSDVNFKNIDNTVLLTKQDKSGSIHIN